jgi:hypothetical protein
MRKTIRFDAEHFQGDSNRQLQSAVDALAEEDGGILEIPAGTYWMNDALHLRNGIEIVGEAGTILKKVPSIASHLMHYVGFGHYEFAVEEPEKYSVGMGISITDNRAGGFYDTTATIVGRNGKFFFIDRACNHDYSPLHEGRVDTLFSLIEARNVKNAKVRNLILDGNSEETRVLNGCRGGGVFLLQSDNIQLQNIEVMQYRDEAISFQQCTDVVVRDCHLHHNSGNGIHPGSGSVRYVLANNRIEHNGGGGIFYCLRTTHSRCENNLIHFNGKAAISIGERDTDHHIRGNQISGNGGAGIEMREPITIGGDRIQIESNQLENNCRTSSAAEILIGERVHDLRIISNKIRPAVNKKAFAVGQKCANIYIARNHVAGHAQDEGDVLGEKKGVAFNAPDSFLDVGPIAALPDSALHLNISTLPTWRDDFIAADKIKSP